MNELFATPVPEGKMLKYEDLRIGMLATFHQVQNIEGVFIYFDEFDRKTSSGRIINYFKQSEKTEKDEQMTEYLSWKNNGLACYFCPEGEYYDWGATLIFSLNRANIKQTHEEVWLWLDPN